MPDLDQKRAQPPSRRLREDRGIRRESAGQAGIRLTGVQNDGEAADILIGLGRRDVLRGKDGDDILIGVNAADRKPGRNEVDKLIGGAGADTFVLGDFTSGVYYLDAGSKDRGGKSYADIQDFQDGDKISFRCYKMGQYALDRSYRVGNATATAIYFDESARPGIGKGDDLIAVVQGDAAAALDLFNFSQCNWLFKP